MAHGSSRLLIDEQPLQVLPSLARAIGLDEAIFLQQVHYWLKHSKHEHEGRVWIFNSYEEWLEQFPFFALRKLERIVNALKSRGLLLVRRQSGFDRKNWYSIDYDAFNALTKSCDIQPRSTRKAIRQNGGIESAKMAGSESAKMAGSESAKMAGSYTESPETTREITASRVSPGEFNQRLMAYHDARIVGGIPDGSKQGKAIKQLYDAGFTPEDCEAVYDSLRGDNWRTSRVDWATVRGEIGTRLPALRAPRKPSNSIAEECGADSPPRTFSTPEEFAAATGKPIDEVRANWNGIEQRPAEHAPAA